MGSFSAPDRFGVDPIVGWRYWYVSVMGNKHLSSPMMGQFEWLPGRRAQALCVEHEGPAPALDCRCGLHAYRNFESLIMPPSATYVLVVWGEVSLWGRVEEHEHGYRAQYAYPYSLHVRPASIQATPQAQRLARRLAAVYAVDTEVEYLHADRRTGPESRDRDHPGQRAGSGGVAGADSRTDAGASADTGAGA